VDKTEALIVLNEAQGLGPRSILELIKRFGSAEAVLKDDALAILKEEGAQTHGWAQSIADSSFHFTCKI
jgi:predicted Rossmann fold nucleotide-binding protein DprA/Smf involved in DNA uptake